jgi:hypothetical protein
MKAKQEMEDAEMRRYVETEKQRRKEADLEKKKMLEQLARDKEERFGKKFDAYTQGDKKEFSAYDNIVYYIKAIKGLYPPFRNGDLTKNCYNTIKVITNNIAKNPTEEKFRKIKLSNQAFQERVGKINLGMKILTELGFEEEGEFLITKNPDIGLYEKTVAYLEEELAKLE